MGLSQIKEIKMEKRELRLPKKIVAKHLVASTQAHHYPPTHQACTTCLVLSLARVGSSSVGNQDTAALCAAGFCYCLSSRWRGRWLLRHVSWHPPCSGWQGVCELLLLKLSEASASCFCSSSARHQHAAWAWLGRRTGTGTLLEDGAVEGCTGCISRGWR